jgi:hypothetical protein
LALPAQRLQQLLSDPKSNSSLDNDGERPLHGPIPTGAVNTTVNINTNHLHGNPVNSPVNTAEASTTAAINSAAAGTPAAAKNWKAAGISRRMMQAPSPKGSNNQGG